MLSGGAAVSAWTDNRYQSKDIDFVSSARLADLAQALAPLGFTQASDRRHFDHPETQWYVEFPAGPVQVGNAIVNDWMRLDTAFGVLHILSPTQMVMDRLAAWFHWNDQPSRAQALMICAEQDIDWDALRRWADGEAEPTKFASFLNDAGAPD